MKLQRLLAASAACLLASALATPAGAATGVLVPSGRGDDTIIGTVVAQQSYTIAISGNSTLCLTCNGGGALTFDSNGIPTTTPVGGYAGFAPNGKNEDPSTLTTDYGIAGKDFNLGSLVFIFATPNGTAIGTSFSLQNGATFTAPGNGTLNALVNDTNYFDNPATGFTVSLTPVVTDGAVPEPATWGLMLLGFGAVGSVMRRKPAGRLATTLG